MLSSILLYNTQVVAQSKSLSSDYILKHWTVDDGLPVNEIVNIAQTQDGYLWLATFDGLVRFDGDQFKVFNTGNIPEFPTNRFIKLQTDRHNNLWVTTEKVQGNEMLIAYRDGQFIVFNSKDGLKGELNLQLDPEGNILVGSHNGAFYYDGMTLKPITDKLKGKAVRKIVVDSTNVFWFATNEGVFRYDDNDLAQFTEQNGLDSRNTLALFIDHQGKVLVATDNGLSLLENDTITSIDIYWPHWIHKYRYLDIYNNPQNPNQIFLIHTGHFITTYENNLSHPYFNPIDQEKYKMDIAIDLYGTIWAQANHNLFRNGELIHTFNNSINHIFPDQIGNIWIAQKGGLTQLKPRFIKSYGDNISNIYALTEDSDNNIWATQNHIKLFQLESGGFNHVNEDLGIPYPRPSYSIYDSDDGQMWIGTVRGVYLWDKKNPVKLITSVSIQENPDKDIPQMKDVKAIHKHVDGDMWFGGANGIHRLDINDKWHYIGKVNGQNILGVRLIYMTRDSTLWFCTNGNGLLYLKNGNLRQLNKDNGLSGNIIRSVYEDGQGILWIGTEGWGLNRLERSTSKNEITRITVYGKRDGLFDNVIHQILEDDQERLWMNSNRGVFWVDRAELTAFAEGGVFKIYSFFYDEKDGLPGREGNGGVQPAGFKSEAGEMWFPMIGGVARIDPTKVEISPLNVFIEEIQVSDHIWYVGNAKEKTFPKGQRDFQIRYSALDFSTSPANIRYRYRLKGYKDQWIEADNRKEAIFNNLSPGTYTFTLMANNGGGWMKNETSLQITLPHFFYETYWFYGLIVLLIIFVIYIGINWRIRMLKQRGRALENQIILRTQDLIREKEETERQKEIATEALVTIERQAAELKELDKAKSRFFTNISHEFRTPLTLIIGPLEYQIKKLRAGIAGDEEDLEVALRNSKRLLRLVNQILDVAKLESGHTQLQAQLIDIRTVIQPIIDAFRALAERNDTQLISQWPDEVVLVYVDIDLIERAIINLVSNAFKFSPKGGKVKVIVKEGDEYISIGIKDNGPGIPKEEQAHIFKRFYQVNESSNGMQPGTGIGLSLVHELVTLHKGKIELISEEGMGAEFLIKLKKGNAHLNDNEYISDKAIQNNKLDVVLEEFAETYVHPADHFTQNNQSQDQPTLLIVEDNADIRAYVRKHLSAEYKVLEAENGLEGFQMTQEALPDLVISDVMMPLSDGYELCQKIKQHPELDFIPVILLTAKAETSMKIEGLELGADDYVTKPFEIDELKARVKNLIQSRQKLKERLAESEVTSKNPDQMGWINTPFANRVRNVVEEHIGDEDFSVVQLAEEVNVGRTTLYTRIVEITGKTPSEMIKLTRLYQAAQLLKEDAGNISEIAYACGFKSISHFSKTFKAEFENSPSEYKRTYSES